MSFDTPAGTRGGRQPRAGLLLRLINKNAASRFRRTGKMLGVNGLILTTVGAKSGAERTSPVGSWPGPAGSWLIVAAANGAARNPAWYHNIAAHPDNVQIEMDGRRIGVTPSSYTGRSVRRPGSRSPPPRPASRNTSARPTASCRSSAWCPRLAKPLPQPAGARPVLPRSSQTPARGWDGGGSTGGRSARTATLSDCGNPPAISRQVMLGWLAPADPYGTGGQDAGSSTSGRARR
jgi:deazaflavin-dependent oxidoreductase (nitroreductase family)